MKVFIVTSVLVYSYYYYHSIVALITFTSSTFNGLESSGVISAGITISGGIVSSKDISIPITFNQGDVSGYIHKKSKLYKVSTTLFIALFLTLLEQWQPFHNLVKALFFCVSRSKAPSFFKKCLRSLSNRRHSIACFSSDFNWLFNHYFVNHFNDL